MRLHIGVALQDAALDPRQTGRELLRLQGRLYGLSSRDAARRTEQLAELIDIGDALDRRIAGYSGGMKRRLDLAAALVHNPEVLFLDEPTTGLDPVSRAAVWQEVERLNRDLGMTIFLTTQYLEEADVLADRVGIIDDGLIVAEGTPAELKRRVGNDLVIITLGRDAEDVRAALAALPDVLDVDAHGNEVVISSENGSAVVSRRRRGAARRRRRHQGADVAQPDARRRVPRAHRAAAWPPTRNGPASARRSAA